jgi:hypothetical protein
MRFTITMVVLGMVAMMAIPGVSGHPASTEGMTPEERLAVMQADFGFAVDPHAAAEFTLHLPTGFTTLDAGFAG